MYAFLKHYGESLIFINSKTLVFCRYDSCFVIMIYVCFMFFKYIFNHKIRPYNNIKNCILLWYTPYVTRVTQIILFDEISIQHYPIVRLTRQIAQSEESRSYYFFG